MEVTEGAGTPLFIPRPTVLQTILQNTVVQLYMAFFLATALTMHAWSSSRPNLVFILADDLDEILNSSHIALEKTRDRLATQGVEFASYYGHIPICCPARASYLSGRYQHNTHTLQNSVQSGCSNKRWQENVEPETFAPILKAAGYRTFFGGKYLNQYGMAAAGGTAHVPPGWDRWIGLVGNSRYFGYTLSVDGVSQHHGQNYGADYLTDLLKNQSVAWVNRTLTDDPTRPFMLMVATPACHGPNDAAPQFRDRFSGSMAPRTPNFGRVRMDGNSLLRAQTAWTSAKAAWSDLVHRRRLQVKLSVKIQMSFMHNNYSLVAFPSTNQTLLACGR